MPVPRFCFRKSTRGRLPWALGPAFTAVAVAIGVLFLNLLAWWFASWLAAILASQFAGICEPFAFSLAILFVCDLLFTAWTELLCRGTEAGLRRAIFHAARLSAQIWAAAVIFVAAAAAIWPTVFRF